MRRSWLWTPLLLIGLAVGSYATYLYLSPAPLPDGLIYGNGHIEGTEVRVSAEVSGRVLDSTLVEGTAVAAGDLLVVLDDADPQIRLREVRAERDAIGKERERVAQQLVTWKHHLVTAEKDLERSRKLERRGTIPQRRLETAEDAAQEAQGRVAALQAQLAQAEARQSAAAERINLLELQLEKARIHAPIAGMILAKAIETGEFATPGRVVAVVVDISRLDLKVYIPERDIAKVKLGDPARVRVDAFPDRTFEATVKRVDQQAQFTPRDVHMPEERTRMVFGVTLEMRNSAGYLKPGMPADSWIRWQADAPWPDRLTVPSG